MPFTRVVSSFSARPLQEPSRGRLCTWYDVRSSPNELRGLNCTGGIFVLSKHTSLGLLSDLATHQYGREDDFAAPCAALITQVLVYMTVLKLKPVGGFATVQYSLD